MALVPKLNDFNMNFTKTLLFMEFYYLNYQLMSLPSVSVRQVLNEFLENIL